jgi:hypothetical protein
MYTIKYTLKVGKLNETLPMDEGFHGKCALNRIGLQNDDTKLKFLQLVNPAFFL